MAGEPSIVMYTDGACKGNPGPGGWAFILLWNGVERGLEGYKIKTTNNEMELTAVLEGLKILKGASYVDVYTDSKYVVDSVEKGWLYNWLKKGEVTANGGTRANWRLWWKLSRLLSIHKVKFHWVKGHNGNKWNEMADRMAVHQRDIADSFRR